MGECAVACLFRAAPARRPVPARWPLGPAQPGWGVPACEFVFPATVAQSGMIPHLPGFVPGTAPKEVYFEV